MRKVGRKGGKREIKVRKEITEDRITELKKNKRKIREMRKEGKRKGIK
jgi:hypothetical protein